MLKWKWTGAALQEHNLIFNKCITFDKGLSQGHLPKPGPRSLLPCMGPSSGNALNVGPYPTPNAGFVHVLAPVPINWFVEPVPLPTTEPERSHAFGPSAWPAKFHPFQSSNGVLSMCSCTHSFVEHVPLAKDPFPSGPKEPGPAKDPFRSGPTEPGPVPNQNRKH
jgi:hypothetical protein